MKIIAKFAFIALVVCFITMGGVKNAYACDTLCQECMSACGSEEGDCLAGCGGIGGPTCMAECQAQFDSCAGTCQGL